MSTAWQLMAIAAVAFAAGGGMGAVLAWRAARSRFMSKLSRTADELKHQHASEAEELRSAQTRAQSELVQARALFKRQLASAAEGPRAAAMQAEERLRAAYDELDRLRREANRAAKGADANDGFAATRPMPEVSV
jgi:hypothetical protein